MKKYLIIENCQDCPFFINAWAQNCRESCKKVGKPIPYKDTDKGYPIPDFCPLPDVFNKPIIHKEHPDYDGGHDPCYG